LLFLVEMGVVFICDVFNMIFTLPARNKSLLGETEYGFLSKRDLLTKRTKRSEELITYVAATPKKGEGYGCGKDGVRGNSNRGSYCRRLRTGNGEIIITKSLAAHYEDRRGGQTNNTLRRGRIARNRTARLAKERGRETESTRRAESPPTIRAARKR
jgi:hypothetical protein